MSKQREHKLTTTKMVAGQEVELVVTYHLHKGDPVIHGQCTRKDNGARYPVSNWKRKIEKEVRKYMFKKALNNDLYRKGEMIGS